MNAAASTAGPRHAHAINVTPMIDVLLVLLIIFMAALPSMRKTVDVQLPDRQPVQRAGDASIVLEIDDAGGFRINTQPVAAGMLATRLREVYAGRPDKVLFVKGGAHVKYNVVLTAMDVARGAGVAVIGLP